MDNKVEVQVAGRRLEVEIEGLSPLEITSIVNKVNEMLEETRRRYPKIADTSKLAIYALIAMATELYRLGLADPKSHRPDDVNRYLDGTPRLPPLDPKIAGSYKPYIYVLVDLVEDLNMMMQQAEAAEHKRICDDL
jgi:hypothetical protein